MQQVIDFYALNDLNRWLAQAQSRVTVSSVTAVPVDIGLRNVPWSLIVTFEPHGLFPCPTCFGLRKRECEVCRGVGQLEDLTHL